MKQSFKQFQLQDFLLRGLDNLGISEPTPIQRQAIPAILQGKDVIGRAHTGTGKTMAYLLPVLQQLDLTRHELQALILAPTRELTGQIAETVGSLIDGTDIELVLIQSGIDINRQIQKLRRNPHIIVGTPGRVLDLINKSKLSSFTVKYLVLDEADTMLEMGFREDIEKIMQKMKRDIQIMLFAATLPNKVAGMTKSFMKQPMYIDINLEDIPPIENVFFKVRNSGKVEALLDLVRLYNPFLGIVFVRKKEQVEGLVIELRQAGFKTESLHGDMHKGQRKQVMRLFREAKSQLLVATDIASRGLDVEGVTHIFNFDLPISLDQYIHRIGRTGRAGESGIAVNIIVATEAEQLRYFADKLNQRFIEKMIVDGEIVDKPVHHKEKSDCKEKTKEKLGGIQPKMKSLTKKFTDPNERKKANKEAQHRKKTLKQNGSKKKVRKKSGK